MHIKIYKHFNDKVLTLPSEAHLWGFPGVCIRTCVYGCLFVNTYAAVCHFLGNTYLFTAGQHLPEAVAVYDTGSVIWKGPSKALPAANINTHTIKIA